MNTQEELLKQAYDALKLHFEPEVGNPITEEPKKLWKPEYNENYCFISHKGDLIVDIWTNSYADSHRHAIGNCYQPHEKERAIWEQITCCECEQSLWDAADWKSGDYWIGFWNNADKKIDSLLFGIYFYQNLPRFANQQSAIDAHTRILGDDAKRYFKGRS